MKKTVGKDRKARTMTTKKPKASASTSPPGDGYGAASVKAAKNERAQAVGNAVDPTESAKQRMAENAAAVEPAQASAAQASAAQPADEQPAPATGSDSETDSNSNDALNQLVDRIKAAQDRVSDTVFILTEELLELGNIYAEARKLFESDEDCEQIGSSATNATTTTGPS